ncbi:MAG: S9 family peptidase [Planctomycetota bacterium]
MARLSRVWLMMLLVSMFVTSAMAQSDRIATSDLLRLRTVQNIDIADNALRAVFTVRSIAEKSGEHSESGIPAYEYQSHIYMLDLANTDAGPVQLTHGRRHDRQPAISPNGSFLTFVRQDDDTEKPQVWLMPLDGGESRPLTSLENGASGPRWSPDGLSVLVSSRVPRKDIAGSPPYPSERPMRGWDDVPNNATPNPDGTMTEIRAWLKRNATESNPTVTNRIAFQDERSLRGEPAYDHLFMVTIRTGEIAQLTRGHRNYRGATFTPDALRIVCIINDDESQHPDRVRSSALAIMNADGTNERIIASNPEYRYWSPKPSRDGSVVAVLGEKLDQPMARQTQLGVVPTAGENEEVIWLTDTSNFDRSVQRFRWMNTRAALLLTAARDGGVPLLTVSTGLLEPTDLVASDDAGAPIGVYDFDQAGGALLYTMTSAANPCTMRIQDARGDREVFDPNEWIAEKRLSRPQEATCTRPDGTVVQYWVMPPVGVDMTKKYPVVLNIHGGPSAMWGPGERSMWHEFQLLAARGYAVVYANPRGSGGYGEAFQAANYQNWGDGPAGDVLDALDHAMINEWLDQDRMVVTGGSYGGYLVAWIVGNDHRFKAAAAQRGVYELNTFFGEGNAWRLVEWAMGGFPWEARIRPIIQRENPFTYVQRIRTPLMILHASQDLRTGVSQSEMMYRALKELDKPVEYVRYPNAGHDLSRTGDPLQRMDRLNRLLEWFDRFLN